MARRSRKQNLQIGTPPRRRSASDIVYEALHEAILSRGLPGGTPLVEAQLAEQFGVSKTPVREALQRLAHSGLVDYELARGATVHSLTMEEIHDIFELRVLLEPLALRQSAPHLTEDEIAELEAGLELSRKALEDGDFHALSQHNSRFHQGLVQHATNHLLLQWLESLSTRRRLISMQGWALENRSQRELEEHRGILEAIKAGDFDRAAERLVQHIERFSQIVLQNPDAAPS